MFRNDQNSSLRWKNRENILGATGDQNVVFLGIWGAENRTRGSGLAQSGGKRREPRTFFFFGSRQEVFWGDFGSRGLEKSVAKDFFWGDFGSRGPVFLGKLGAADQF